MVTCVDRKCGYGKRDHDLVTYAERKCGYGKGVWLLVLIENVVMERETMVWLGEGVSIVLRQGIEALQRGGDHNYSKMV